MVIYGFFPVALYLRWATFLPFFFATTLICPGRPLQVTRPTFAGCLELRLGVAATFLTFGFGAAPSVGIAAFCAGPASPLSGSTGQLGSLTLPAGCGWSRPTVTFFEASL